jgi:hypothetical protein
LDIAGDVVTTSKGWEDGYCYIRGARNPASRKPFRPFWLLQDLALLPAQIRGWNLG